MDISEFVPQSCVDPIYFDKAYYLGPDKGGERAYSLLRASMRETKRVALAHYAARGKQYLVMVRPMEDGLVMQQLYYPDEVRGFDDIPLGDPAVKPTEVQLAVQLIEQIASDKFQPHRYEDHVKKRILEAVQRKIDGQEVQSVPRKSLRHRSSI
ncbi:MAG: Ku protein [Myxococcota bacterium]